jgi:formylglycine-generating enzyme required for sulfatase activity
MGVCVPRRDDDAVFRRRDDATDQANYDGNDNYAGGPKGEFRQRTVPVGTLRSNPWGSHEMHGNVWEWVEDHWHTTYEGAPADGSAWVASGDQSKRVLRGGSWFKYPRNLRSATRGSSLAFQRDSDIGFRVARTLS